MPGGIKELVADVEVKAVDMAASAIATATLQGSAVTTAKIADANVTTAKIADANVTDAKIAPAVGKWNGATFTGPGTTAFATWTCTSACTILDAIVQITAAHSLNCTMVLQDTGATTQIIPSVSCSTAVTIRATVATALGSEIPVIELAAGEALELTGSVASNNIKGKIFVEYIETPS